MDYEKKYKEALERVRRLHDRMLVLSSTDALVAGAELEFIFPELKENEDERIRNGLIAHIQGHLNTQDDFTRRQETGPFSSEEVKFFMDALAWLEKQKEQKPILEVFGFKVGDAVRLKDGDGRKHIIKSFEEVEGLHGPNFYHVEFEDNSARDGIYPGEEYPNGYYTQMEKFEEEQEPADLSKMMVHKEPYIGPVPTPMVADEQKSAEPSGKLSREEYLYQLLIDQLITYSDYEYLTGKNPVWSEGDEKMLENIRYALRYAFDKQTAEYVMTWLKALHPQKLDASKLENFDPVDVLNRIKTEWPMAWEKVVGKQEWSEEDEEMLEYAIGDLNDAKQLFHAKDAIDLCDKEIAWLKSLRPQPKRDCKDCAMFLNGECTKPHWKPSEEQMAALEAATVRYQSTGLESLYEDLKKL